MNPFHIAPSESSPGSAALTHFVFRGSFEVNKDSLPGWSLHLEESRQSDCDFFDTYVWSLWFGNAILAREGSWSLCADGELWGCEEFNSIPNLADDFPHGDLRAALTNLTDIRALKKTASVHLKRERWEISDHAGRVVSHLSICQIATIKSRNIRTTLLMLEPTSPQKTYGTSPAEAILAAGCKPTETNLVQEAYKICRVRPVPYSLKPRLSFAPATHARTVLLEVFSSLLSIARWNEEGISKDIDTEFLHDFRVALRKLRSVMGQIKGVFPEGLTALWKNQIGDICRKTNKLRDYDVYLLSRRRLENLLPEELRDGLDAFFAELRTERLLEAKRVAEFLQSDSYKNTISSLQDAWGAAHLIEPGPNSERAIRDVSGERIRKRFQRIRKISRAITPETPDSVIHSIRIDCKKMRYLLECFGHLFPSDVVDPLGKQLAKLQNRLGRYNDTSLQQDYLLQHAGRHLESGDTRFALSLGGLIGSLHHEHSSMRDTVCEALDQFSRSSNKRRAADLTKTPKVSAED